MFTKYATKIGGDNERERERESKPLRRFVTTFFLILSLLLQNFLFLVNPVYAATSPWTQTDWVGGSGQTSWSDNTKFDSSSSVTTSTAGQVTLQATSSWYNTSWAYRRKITFDNSAQTENLTNFPVLVKLDSTRINYSNTQDSGQDIRLTDSDGTTLLSYEIEKWDETGSSYVWVKVPQIDASSSTDSIYMYYGNTSATDAQAATSVWDSNHVLVQHLAETSGQIDGAQTFDGSNDKVSMSSAIVPTSGNFSISTWFKTTDITNNKVLVSQYGSPYPAGR